MRRTVWLRLAILVAAACGKSAPQASPPDAAPRALAAGDVYRAPGRTASLAIPALEPGWTIVSDRQGDTPLVTFFWGTREHFKGYASFLFYPRARGNVDAAQIVAQEVAELRKGAAHLQPVGNAESFVLPGGAGYEVQLSGVDPRGVRETMNVMAVVEGSAAVGVVFRGGLSEMNGGALERAASPLLAGLKVGKFAE